MDYIYDLLGKIKSVTDPTGTYGFGYDNMGRLIGTSTSYSFLPGQNYANNYTYDAASNRTGFTAPDGSTNTYSYDTLNRLSSLTNSLTGQFGFGYDALSRRTSLTRPNGVNTTYSYDSLSRLLSILHQSGTTTIDGATYTLDSAGNRTSKLNQLDGVTENYTYDPIYQLTQVQQVVNGNTNTTESYTYDGVGNRLSSLNVASYTYNNLNQLTASSDGYGYTYDFNGNTLTKSNSSGSTQYTWDFENRLATLTLPNGGGLISFKYDPFGRRIQNSSQNGLTNYLYDDSNSVEEVDGSGSVLAQFGVGLGIDETFSIRQSGATSFFDADGLESTTSLTSAVAQIAATYTYNAFGSLNGSSGAVANSVRYTGRGFDSEAGLYYYRARYYDPTVGRFLSEDEIGNDEGANLYVYVGNSPTGLRDPTGYTKYKGFPPGREQQMRDAVQAAINKLGSSGGCDGCAGGDGPKLIHALENATFVYKPDLDSCGYTPIPGFKRTHIGESSFDAGRCCDLASTLAHEAVHMNFGTENKAYALEKKCFNCGTGHPPKRR